MSVHMLSYLLLCNVPPILVTPRQVVSTWPILTCNGDIDSGWLDEAAAGAWASTLPKRPALLSVPAHGRVWPLDMSSIASITTFTSPQSVRHSNKTILGTFV